MKKLIAFILLLCLALTLVACNNQETPSSGDNTPEDNAPDEGAKPEDNAPQITIAEVYDAGKSLAALLGDHENVLFRVVSNGTLIREEYWSDECYYLVHGAEYMDAGFDYAAFTTDHSEYFCFEGLYGFNITITPSGILDTKERFAQDGAKAFISSAILDDDVTITEKDGTITVTCVSDMKDIVVDEGVVSCVETYTLDAKTREMTSVRTVYTFEDGSTDEGFVTITRDVEIPEGMKPFLAYEQDDVAMRTVTIISNPGAENEKTDIVQTPKGPELVLSSYWEIAETYTLYADAACTQPIEEAFDPNADLTVYVKWSEQ